MTKQRALVKAAAKGDVGEVQKLIQSLKKSYMNLDYIESGFRALSIASLFGHIDCTELFLSHGASINLQDSIGQTALLRASQNTLPALKSFWMQEPIQTSRAVFG